MSAARESFRLAVVGEVDHGKSTVIGRLLHDSGQLMDGKAEAVRRVSGRRGRGEEWAFVLDAFQTERDQGITIDASTVWFSTARREYTVADLPGHRDFVRNMITGSADCDAALLVLDAAEGVREQTRRHLYLLRLLGARGVAVAVNKMDLVGFSADAFARAVESCAAYLARIGLPLVAAVPIVGRDGDGMVGRSPRLAWHDGPTLVEALDSLPARPAPAGLPFRMPVQDVYRFDDRRLAAGRIESGTVAVGDTVLLSPSDVPTRIRSIEVWPQGARPSAAAGESVGLSFEEEAFVERGSIVSHVERAPVLSNTLRATMFWLAPEPLAPGRALVLRMGARDAPAIVQSVDAAIDVQTLEETPSGTIERNGIARVTLRSPQTLALDAHADNPGVGRFALVDGRRTVGGGLVDLEGCPDQRRLLVRRATNVAEVAHGVTAPERTLRNAHRGAVVWLTGLSGAGKSTLAMRLERDLFARGVQAYTLDGDNLRTGLNADLGFSPTDRIENIRRVGEVAALFADAGLVVVTAFISPYQAGRDHARAAARGAFHEIHVRAPVDVCETRDPKGLYAKARRGEIREFTGVSAAYEAPARPELVVDTAAEDTEACARRLLEYVLAAIRPDGG